MANSSAGRGVEYTVIFQNNSSNAVSACIYQVDTNIFAPNAQSLAWFAKAAAPTTRAVFNWTVDYCFTWAETGELIPGVLFAASQTWAADLTSTNQITFSTAGGMYMFSNQQQGPRPGSLYIREDSAIPLKQAAVGIGMSGAGTFAMQAQPNMNLVFTPNPKYYITFGEFTPGEVLDIPSIANKAELQFPPNVYSMTAVLNEDNTWSVMPTSQVNPRMIGLDAQRDE
ncbi:MAG TPA: protein rhiA [Thermoanaerobaculia bacterium]